MPIYLAFNIHDGIPKGKNDDKAPYKELIQYACQIDYPVFNKKLTTVTYLDSVVRYSAFFGGNRQFVTHLFSRLFSDFGVLNPEPAIASRSSYLILSLCERL